MNLTEDSRQAIADVLEIVARDGLSQPWDLDGALDAIEASIEFKMVPIPIDIAD